MTPKNNRTYSNKSFGYFISSIFFIIALYLIIFQNSLNYEALFLFIISILLSIFYPKIFHIPADLWYKFGLFLNLIFSPIILVIIYLIAIIIPSIICKIFNRKIIDINYEHTIDSYWSEKKYLNDNKTNLKEMH